MKIFLMGGNDHSLVNFRGNLISDMVKRGHEVFAAAPPELDYIPNQLKALGAEFVPVVYNRVSLNPVRDVGLVNDLHKILQRYRPDVFLGYTAKPAIFGSIAARRARVPYIASMITGSGFTFQTESIRNRMIGLVLRRLYGFALSYSERVFFQNSDDLNAFIDGRLIAPQKCILVNGSGVDLSQFPRSPLARGQKSFLLTARMIRDKGICEYAAAAKIVKQQHPNVQFHLVGPIDPNPKGLKRHEIAAWEREGIIQYHEFQADVRPFLDACSVFVLPSYYREGVPRTLLEALAVGRPIITTDSVGCRETIQRKGPKAANSSGIAAGEIVEGENGFLVPPRDSLALSRAMLRLIDAPGLMQSMATASRRLACERFDVNIVNRTILEALGL